MRYLMLMWADADAASGDESDFQAWAEFNEQVKANGAFVLNGALVPASTGAPLVQTAIARHALGEAVERRPFAEGRASHSGSAACSTESRYESQADGDAAAITARASAADELPVAGQSNR